MTNDLCAVCDQEQVHQEHHALGHEEFACFKVPLCKECHKLVHSVPLSKWKATDWNSTLPNLWASSDKLGRVLILKAMLVCREWMVLKNIPVQDICPPWILGASWLRRVMKSRANVPKAHRSVVMSKQIHELTEEINVLLKIRGINSCPNAAMGELISRFGYYKPGIIVNALRMLRNKIIEISGDAPVDREPQKVPAKGKAAKR